MYLSFNQITALLGVLYAALLFYEFEKLKKVWEREAVRSRNSLALYAILILATGLSGGYIYYLSKRKKYLQKKAARLIQQEKKQPLKIARGTFIGRVVKIVSTLLLTFISLHRIIRKT